MREDSFDSGYAETSRRHCDIQVLKVYKIYTRDATCRFSIFAVNIETFLTEISRKAIIRDV